jgi:hypothetical protein
MGTMGLIKSLYESLLENPTPSKRFEKVLPGVLSLTTAVNVVTGEFAQTT